MTEIVTADSIILANIITMDPARPRAQAVAFNSITGVIAAVGSVEEAQKAITTKSTKTYDLGACVLMPGFIDPHNHPLASGATTEAPAYWIAPYATPPKEAIENGIEDFKTYDNVKKFWRYIEQKNNDNTKALIFNGLDRMLQKAPELTNKELDLYFPSGRKVVVLDNSGHEAYFSSSVIAGNTTSFPDQIPVTDPTGGRFGRVTQKDVDNDQTHTLILGASNGRAYETPAIQAAVYDVLQEAISTPRVSAASWYQRMAENGITTTSEHTYGAGMLDHYVALATAPNSPLRVGLYHMSTDKSDCGAKLELPSTCPPARLWKQGIKLWADGSPWVGSIASSFPYLDNETVTGAGIQSGVPQNALNYTREQLDKLLDAHAAQGWQFAFHCNGDIALDMVLDAYQRALVVHGLLGTDHRWRVEHCGGCRGDQFARAAALGVMVSLPPFQFIYWGDLLDGKIFDPQIGSQWVRAGDAVRSGARVSFHNDGSVSPPIPLLNMQVMVTRRCTPEGEVHGPEQAVTLHDALMAHTVNAAYHLKRHDLGSITERKLADFVELSNDPYEVDIEKLAKDVKVLATWSNGKRLDKGALDDFVNYLKAHPGPKSDATGHAAAFKRCC